MKEETLYNTIIEILEKDPKTRDDDILLIFKCLIKLRVAKNQKDKLIIDLLKYDEIPSFETIRRIRQKIQNEEKLYTPSESCRDKRNNAEKEYKNKFSSKNSAYNYPNSHLMSDLKPTKSYFW